LGDRIAFPTGDCAAHPRGMKPNQKKKGTSPGQLKLFWDELDITNEEIIKAATIFVKANCYTPNPQNSTPKPWN